MKKTVSIVLVAALLASAMSMMAFAGAQNTWNGSDIARLDSGATSSVGYRFALQGTGSLIGVNAHIAGSACTFDFKVYEWKGNHVDTLKTTPVASVLGIKHAADDTWWYSGHTIEIPSGSVVAGKEYYAVIDNVTGASWALCNYVSAETVGFRAYWNGSPYTVDGAYTSLMWQLVYEDGTWGKADALSEDTEPTPSLDPVEPTRVISTWGEGIQMGNDRFDGVGTAEVGYRFVTTGSNGKLVAIIPYMAGTAGEFDCLVYAWNTDYATTVAGEPLVTVRDVEFDGTSWTSWKSKIYLGSGLDAGEYLAVLTNFDNTSWAICSYKMAPSTGFRAYFNGVPAEYDGGGYKSLAWQLGFTGDGNALRTELVDPAALPEITASISDEADDGKIDHLYLNAAISASETRQVGIIFSDSEASCEAGAKPLFIRVAEEGHGKSAGGFIQSGCYGGHVITAANLGGEEGDSVIAVYWQDMPKNIGTLYARTFAKNSDGTYDYGAIATIVLKDGADVLPLANS